MNNRAIAALTLNKVLKDKSSLNTAFLSLGQYKKINLSYVKAINFECCRHFFTIDFIISKYLLKPLKNKDTDIFCLLIIGCYELLFETSPEHAVISECVNACKDLKKLWAKNLVNGILRQIQRDKIQLKSNITSNIVAKYSHPSWLIDLLKKNWPNDHENILTNNNQHPPMVIRVNQLKISRDDYSLKLKDLNIEHEISKISKDAIVLKKPMPVETLPGFNEGQFFVQDIAPQLAAKLLDLEPKLNILDACAAPGGKTTHIIELTKNQSTVTAVDISKERIKQINDNLFRLGQKANVICANAFEPETWSLGIKYDRILIDAPCSATGVIRRHPDIKLLRQGSDITEFPKTQIKILKALWPYLKPGGILLYATCSILKSENSDVINEFLKDTYNAKEMRINEPYGIIQEHGIQILPGFNNLDGFYYAKLTKT